MGKKMFDYVIGNPPYQEDTENDGDRKSPVYNIFMDEAYKVSNAVELITPARFLFNAGQTPRECKIVCVNRYCMNLLYAPYWGKQR